MQSHFRGHGHQLRHGAEARDLGRRGAECRAPTPEAEARSREPRDRKDRFGLPVLRT